MANHHLAIDINTQSVKFTKLNGHFVVDQHSFTFLEKQDYRYKQQLEEFWEEMQWKQMDFDEVTISWSEKDSTLVPTNVFNESDKDAIYQLCFGVNTIGGISYDRLPMQGVVNVYSIPMWVKSFFVMRFPRVIIQHEGTHLIRGVFNGQTFKLKAKIICHENHFMLALVKESNLIFYSTFEYQSLEDLIYYFSYSLQQLGLQDQDVEIELACGSGTKIDMEEVSKMLKLVHKTKATIIINNQLIENYQLLCV